MMDDQEVTFDRIKQVKEDYHHMLMSLSNVVGLGLGYAQRGGEVTDQPALVVMVSHKVPTEHLSKRDLIPTELDGVPVDVQAVGEIRAQD